MSGDLPSFVAGSYATSTYDPSSWGTAPAIGAPLGGHQIGVPFNENGVYDNTQAVKLALSRLNEPKRKERKQSEIIEMVNPQRRLVQVFIVDPDENVPLDQAVLFSGEQKFTDLTDQELFFELDVKGLLDAHNKKRVEWTDKSIKSKEKKLEPARIRDLKMLVVTVASF